MFSSCRTVIADPLRGGGQELRDGIVQVEPVLPGELEHDVGGDRLGDAADAHVVVELHRTATRHRGRAQRRTPGALARRVDEHEGARDLQLLHQRGDLRFERGGVRRWGLLRGSDGSGRRRGAGGEGETEQRQSDAEAGAEHADALRSGHGCLTVKVGGVRFA
jgi:hypothetical protein